MKTKLTMEYISPATKIVLMCTESFLCASTGTMGSTNESLNEDEVLTGDITFGW